MHLLSEDLQRVFPRDPALGFRYPDVGNAHYADLVTGCRIFQPCSLVQSNFRVLPLLSRGRAYAALLRHPVIKSLIRSVMGNSPYMIAGYSSYVVGAGSAGGNFHQDGKVGAQIGGETKPCTLQPPYCTSSNSFQLLYIPIGRALSIIIWIISTLRAILGTLIPISRALSIIIWALLSGLSALSARLLVPLLR
jgi:hypothetical protein